MRQPRATNAGTAAAAIAFPHVTEINAVPDVIESVHEDRPRRAHYHPIGITFHWLMAGLVIFQLWWGWRTTWIPPGYDKLDAYEVHALVGAVLLILATMRGGWRIIAPFLLPALEEPEDFPGWQKRASQLTHIALYACMFAMPVSGWLMLSLSAPEAGLALPWGWTWPVLPFVQDLAFVERARLEQAAESAHLWIAWFMLGLVVLHVGAALQHQIIKQDEVLARMIPWLSREKPRA